MTPDRVCDSASASVVGASVFSKDESGNGIDVGVSKGMNGGYNEGILTAGVSGGSILSVNVSFSINIDDLGDDGSSMR